MCPAKCRRQEGKKRGKFVTTVKMVVTMLLTLREEHGLRVFENRVLRRTFGPKRDEVELVRSLMVHGDAREGK